MQQVSQGAPSSVCLCIELCMYFCVCGHVYMLLFVDSCRTPNKNLSCVLLWEGMGRHQTNPTEWLLNQTGLNGAANKPPVPPLAFWLTSVPLDTHRARSSQPPARMALQHQ